MLRYRVYVSPYQANGKWIKARKLWAAFTILEDANRFIDRLLINQAQYPWAFELIDSANGKSVLRSHSGELRG